MVKAPLARSVWPMVVVVVVLLVVGLVVKVLEAPGWKFLVAVVLVGVVVVLALYLRSKPAAWSTGAGEWRENAGPWLLRVLFRFLSGLLSVVIAVTVVLAYQETVSTEEVSTWGTGLDLVVAIGLGVLAHRAVQSLRTASEGVSEYIGGGAKPKGDKAEEKADEKGSESPGGATPATPAKPAG